MSISPAQMVLPAASVEGSAPSGCTPGMAVPAATPAASLPADSPPGPAAAPPPQLSTDVRIDDRHQIYYEFVDDGSGDVLFEIPPEALRAIGESLNIPLVGDASASSIDVKS